MGMPTSQTALCFPAISIDRFIKVDFPPREELLSPWLPATGLAMIYAPRGIGKTFLALSIAYAVATGGSVLGWSAPKVKRVLYIDGEMTGRMLQDRLRTLVDSHPKPISPAPFQILTRDMISLVNAEHPTSPPMPDLATARGQQDLESLAKSVDLIVIDNISTLCPQTKENEADAWEPVQKWALSMRGLGKAILFIHHAGKSGQQRGTSKREDILDTIISLKPAPLRDPNSGAAFNVNFEKTRGFYGEQAQPFFAQLQVDRDGKQTWIKESPEPDTKSKVQSLCKQGLTQKAVAAELAVDKSTVSRYWPK